MKHRLTACVCLASVAVAFAVVAETVTVEASSVKLRQGANRMMPMVAEVPRGTTLEVISRKQAWVELRSADKTGWAAESDLKFLPGQIGASKKIDNQSLSATGVEESAAAKGLQSGEASVYARSTGQSTASLNKLRTMNNNVADTGAWLRFASDGNVGKR